MIWLPCFHDMGMTGYLTVHVGAELVMITPMDFLRDTLWWAKLIDKHKGTTTAAPNFAYNLFANRLRKQATAGEFDLSSLRWALSGAEQVDPLDVEGLCDAGAPFGLKPEAIIPAYGMAETTVAVSFSECGGGMVTDEVDWPKLWCRVVDHDLTPGGRTTYFMTGPDGDKHAGYWQITAVDEPTSFSFVDGCADLDFNPDPALPVSRNVYTFAEHGGGTRAIYVSTFESAEALQQVLDMGVVEGATSAINQIDDLVAS